MSIRMTNRQRRMGVVLPLVLVGLLVVTVFGAAIAQSMILQSRRARRLEWQQQAGWLAESGVQRASNRLANEAGYDGETWRIDRDRSGLDADAVVVIQVDGDDATDGGQIVTVEALYPADSKRRVASWRELTIRPPVREASE